MSNRLLRADQSPTRVSERTRNTLTAPSPTGGVNRPRSMLPLIALVVVVTLLREMKLPRASGKPGAVQPARCGVAT